MTIKRDWTFFSASLGLWLLLSGFVGGQTATITRHRVEDIRGCRLGDVLALVDWSAMKVLVDLAGVVA